MSFVQENAFRITLLPILLVFSLTLNSFLLNQIRDTTFASPKKVKLPKCPSRTKTIKQPHFTPNIVSMHYNNPWDRYGIEHNCILARDSGFTMNVFTENLEYDYCKVCKCYPLNLMNCKPPDPLEGAPNFCEKMNFISESLERFKEVVFLDADLVVLDPNFYKYLAARAYVHDFLAPYAEGSYNESFKYRNTFNGGLMFIRTIPGANHSDLLPMMYRFNSGCDQYMVSAYIHKYYRNWDSLSWKWHCRGLKQYKMDIPIEDCITLHQRGPEGWELLEKLNYTLKTISGKQAAAVSRILK